jgi:hypothetical protein
MGAQSDPKKPASEGGRYTSKRNPRRAEQPPPLRRRMADQVFPIARRSRAWAGNFLYC